jgi:hypothetical protein
MAWVLSYELKCDGPGENGKGCAKWSDAQLDRREAVEWARKCGWLVLARKHYCPKCRQLKEKYAITEQED